MAEAKGRDFDVIVIGGGAAGLSAAVNVRARGKTVLVADDGGGALRKAHLVNNYIGLPSVSGSALLSAFREHAEAAGARFVIGRVTQITGSAGAFSSLVGADVYTSRAVVLATGAAFGESINGEERLLGKGVSYCATCDGMLYRGKDVVLVKDFGGDGSHIQAEYEQDRAFLLRICGSVSELTAKEIASVDGGDFVTGVTTVGGNSFGADGVFIVKETLPPSSLIYGLDVTGGAINADADGKTNIAGVFACGDVTGGLRQVSAAAAAGQKAGLSAAKV